MFGLWICLIAVGGLMEGLLVITLVLTVIIKICHPEWSWKRCAQESTLI